MQPALSALSFPCHQYYTELAASQMTGYGGSGRIVLEAPCSVDKLGLSTQGVPPNVILVDNVMAGGWADTQGVVLGDRLVAVNGRSVNCQNSITAEDFKSAMAARPLHLQFSHNRPVEKLRVLLGAEQPSDLDLGLSLEGVPPDERIVVLSVEPGGWAEQHGIKQYDVLAAFNDVPTFKMTSNDEVSQIKMLPPLQRPNKHATAPILLHQYTKARPLTLDFERGSLTSSKEAPTADLTADNVGEMASAAATAAKNVSEPPSSDVTMGTATADSTTDDVPSWQMQQPLQPRMDRSCLHQRPSRALVALLLLAAVVMLVCRRRSSFSPSRLEISAGHLFCFDAPTRAGLRPHSLRHR